MDLREEFKKETGLRTIVEACNMVCSNHNYEVEWHTVKEVS